MKNYQGFVQVEEVIGQMIKPILGKKKGNFAIITSLNKAWPTVIGEKFQQFCAPKDIKFERSQKINGTLIIKAYNPSVAFFLEANSSQIIERIAIYYGYKVISQIKIHQEPKDIKAKTHNIEVKISAPQQQIIDNVTESVTDPDLRAILSKLGGVVFTK